MAHVPPCPGAGDDEVQWVHRFQLACALLVASNPEAAPQRMVRLFELAADEDDWSAAAALMGLRLLADRCRELTSEIDLFGNYGARPPMELRWLSERKKTDDIVE